MQTTNDTCTCRQPVYHTDYKTEPLFCHEVTRTQTKMNTYKNSNLYSVLTRDFTKQVLTFIHSVRVKCYNIQAENQLTFSFLFQFFLSQTYLLPFELHADRL